MPPVAGSDAAPQMPEEYTKPGTTLSLGQLVDVALRNNPTTREAWFVARAAAAEVGSRRSLYFPVRRGRSASIERQKTADRQQPVHLPPDDLRAVDRGRPGCSSTSAAREADVQEATRILYAADWTHNAAIQDVVLAIGAGATTST